MRGLANWLVIAAIAAILAGSALAQTAAQSTANADSHRLDPEHSRLLFRVNHPGLSHCTALVTQVDATFDFAPGHPQALTLQATVDTASLETHNPSTACDFNKIVTGAERLNAAVFPQMTFAGTSVAPTGLFTADVTGGLTLHGVAKPVVLHVTFNGGYSDNASDPDSRIGFSATGRLNRSDFGMATDIPEPGTTTGVFDAVEIIIETEMQKPAPAPRGSADIRSGAPPCATLARTPPKQRVVPSTPPPAPPVPELAAPTPRSPDPPL